MTRLFQKISLAVLLLSTLAFSQSLLAKAIPLSQPLSGNLLEGVYSVNGLLEIPAGAVLDIGPGVTIHFGSYSGFVVNGALIARGTADKPVLLTSDKDFPGTSIGSPFDWNGIKVYAAAQSVTLSHTIIQYATVGLSLDSYLTPLKLTKVNFLNNGYTSITRETNAELIFEGTLVDMSWNQPGHADRPGKQRKIAAIGSGIIGVACAIVAVPFFNEAVDANREGNTARLQSDIDKARSRESGAIVKGSIMSGSAAILVPTAAVLFIMEKKKGAKPGKIGFAPSIGWEHAGMHLTFRF